MFKNKQSFCENFLVDKPSTGKKRSKRKPSKKSKHKHDYIDVICIYKTDVFGQPYKHAVLRKKCTICGKLDGWIHPTIKDPISCGFRMMEYDEIMKTYKGLEIIEYD